MVPVDGSTFSERAVDYAVAVADRAKGEVHLTLVHEPMPHWAAQTDQGTLDEQGREGEQAYLNSLVDKLREETSFTVSGGIIGAPEANALEEHAVKRGFTTRLLNRPVAAALALHAQERRAGLVVLSTHGRGAVRRLWLGSVAEQLVWQIERPILLIKPEQEDGTKWSKDFRHILVPLDGSEASEAIIEDAMAFGRLFGARYTLLLVQGDPFPYAAMPPQMSPEAVANLVDDQVKITQVYLDGVVNRFAAEGLEAEGVSITNDSPTAGILQVADERDVDLIAMSTHGGGVRSLLMGSVTSRVVQRAEVPILVTRPKIEPKGS